MPAQIATNAPFVRCAPAHAEAPQDPPSKIRRWGTPHIVADYVPATPPIQKTYGPHEGLKLSA